MTTTTAATTTPEAGRPADAAHAAEAAHGAPRPEVRAFHDPRSGTMTYLVWCPETRAAAVVDPVLDYDHATGAASAAPARAVLDAARALSLRVKRVLETHVHADHLSAAPWVKARCPGARLGIGEGVREVRRLFRPVFGGLADDVPPGGDFDDLFADGEAFALGALRVEVLHVPGHTPACVAYRVGPDLCLVGDTLFMPDSGTARADFPGGDARALYRSIRRLLALPEDTRLLVCHDYKAPGRDAVAWEATVAEQRARNPHVRDGIGEDEYVAVRTARDATLAPPALLIPSIQVNLRAGHLPEAEANGVRYLRVPVTLKDG